MDRQIVYPGAIPLETDLLNTNKNTMIALSKQALLISGTTTVIHGLSCTPTSPASMTINIGPGQIYSSQNIDSTAYSSLSADTAHNIIKQGILLDPVPFTLTAPSTSGQSVNYLIQVAYQDVDSGSTVLPYYNAANPSVAWSGPANSGSAQNTVRSGVCSVVVKTGVAAITGMQSTPTPDAGYVGAWVVTVANGQTAITSTGISRAPNAPFLPSNGIVSGIQSSALVYAKDTGFANSYFAAFSPPITSLVDGTKVTFKANVSNTGASTFSANGLTSYPIYGQGQQALQGGEIVANGLVEVQWNSSLTAWVMTSNSGGATPVGVGTQSNHAMQLGQASGRLLRTSVYTNISGTQYVAVNGGIPTTTGAGSFAALSSTNAVEIECQGAGSGGGGISADGVNPSVAGGGGAGTYGIGRFTTGFSSLAITVGAGGAGGLAGNNYGSIGGTSSAGALISCPAGYTGKGGASTVAPYINGGSASSDSATGANLYQIRGGSGAYGFAVGSLNAASGAGGISKFGAGGSAAANTAGVNAINYGAGGSGACAYSTTSTNLAGGSGMAGIVIIREYA